MVDVNKPFGIIDISSNEIRLRIAEKKNDYFKFIETLSYPLALGKDTFNNKKISFEKLDKACDIIKNYLQVLKEFGVTEYRAIATTAVREASNRDYVIDQIKIKTGLDIDIIDNSEEKIYIYKLMFFMLEKHLKQSSMLVYIGSGSVGLSILQDEKLVSTESVNIGTLRVFEIFENMQGNSKEFHKIIEEYLKSFTETIFENITSKIEYFIATGREAGLIADLCNSKKDKVYMKIEKENFVELYENIKEKSIEEISEKYNIPIEKSEILLPAMCIYKNMVEVTDAKYILTPLVFLSDALAFEAFCPKEFLKMTKEVEINAAYYASIIAKKYRVQEEHSEYVDKFSLKIFDKMKKIHGLGKREKYYLKISAILHDVGKFINIKNHYRNSYNILSLTDIIGINKRELAIIANISLYHSSIVPSLEDANYKSLERSDRVLVSKLTAILRIADALDRSHGQKITDIEVKISEKKFILIVYSNKNIELEEWAVREKGKFFQDVFGLKIYLQKKKVN